MDELDRTASTRLQQLLDGSLPVVPVKEPCLEARQVNAIDAAQVYDPHDRVDSGVTERAHATVFAEIVLGCHGAELIESQIIRTRQNAEVSIISAVPKGAFHATDGAIALNGRANATFKFEGNALAMA